MTSSLKETRAMLRSSRQMIRFDGGTRFRFFFTIWLNISSYIIIYTALLCVVLFTVGIDGASFFGGITTIEKAFRFTSLQMGVINAMFVVGFAGERRRVVAEERRYYRLFNNGRRTRSTFSVGREI